MGRLIWIPEDVVNERHREVPRRRPDPERAEAAEAYARAFCYTTRSPRVPLPVSRWTRWRRWWRRLWRRTT